MVKQLELEALFFVIVGALVGMFLVSYTRSTPVQFFSNAASPVNETVIPTGTPTPSPVFIATTTTTSQISPDGTKKVMVNETKERDGSQTYALSVDSGKAFFTTTLGANESLTIPYNTWASNDNYFFIQEQTSSGPKVFVFKASGEPFSDSQQYLDLTDAFVKRTDGSGNTFDQATGWAEGNLIIINTKRSDGSQGASYWYEVPDGAVIPLSTKF
jgi:hypothetical protein